MSRYDAGWQKAIEGSSHSYNTGGSAGYANVPSKIGAEAAIIGAATATFFVGYQAITAVLTSATVMTASFIGNQVGKAQEHGAKCYAGIAAHAAVGETPKNLKDILWNDRTWTDYLPFTGAGAEPAIVTAIRTSQTGVHNLDGVISEEAGKDALTMALGGDSSNDVVQEGKKLLNRGVKKLIAAECEDFNGTISTIQLGLLVLGAITATLIAVRVAKSYFSKDR